MQHLLNLGLLQHPASDAIKMSPNCAIICTWLGLIASPMKRSVAQEGAMPTPTSTHTFALSLSHHLLPFFLSYEPIVVIWRHTEESALRKFRREREGSTLFAQPWHRFNSLFNTLCVRMRAPAIHLCRPVINSGQKICSANWRVVARADGGEEYLAFIREAVRAGLLPGTWEGEAGRAAPVSSFPLALKMADVIFSYAPWDQENGW